MQKVVRGIAYYTAENGVNSGFINTTGKAASEWRNSGEYKGEQLSEDDFLRAVFKEQAQEFIHKTTAPQVPAKQGDTKAIWDSL